MLTSAYDDVRLDSHSLKILYARLSRLCFQLLGSAQVGNQCNMDQDGVFVADIMLELSDGLKEGLALDVTHRSADFNDGDARVCIGEVAVEAALDLICDVRDDLHGAAAVIAAALLL